MPSDFQDQNREQLLVALQNWEDAEKNKEEAPASYIASLLDVANAYRLNKELTKANQYFEDAVALFATSKVSPMAQNIGRTLWSYLSSADLEIFERNFSTLLTACERSLYNSGIDPILNSVINSGIRDSAFSEFAMTYWRQAVEIRASLKGEEHASLAPLLKNLVLACEQKGNLRGAEETTARLAQITRNTNLENLAICYHSLCTLYLQHDYFDKAKKALLEALVLEPTYPLNKFTAKYVSLAEAYKIKGRKEELKTLIEMMLSKASDQSLSQLEMFLERILFDYLISGELVEAQKLMEERLKASENCFLDMTANSWRLRLSECYLKLGRREDSQKLFQKAISAMALNGIDTKKPLEERHQLLKKLGPAEESKPLAEPDPIGPNQIKIPYGLFATQEIRFGPDVTVQFFDPFPHIIKEIESAGKEYEAALCSPGLIVCEGKLTAAGVFHGEVAPPDAVGRYKLANAPLPTKLQPLPPALKPPTTELLPLPESGILRPGNYLATSVTEPLMLDPRDIGTVRIFLRDEVAGSEFIFDSRVSSLVDDPRRAVHFQVWYNGTKKLRLHGMKALIYTPNATVEIADNCRFYGAIVANRIHAKENNELSIDLSLIREVFRT